MLSITRERVARHTDEEINARIRQETEATVDWYRRHPERIPERLTELDEEWDIERTLEANAAAASLAGIALAAFVDRRWLVLPTAVAGFLMQHATQGWCPPLPVFRRMGVRTAQEIEAERRALLRALEGGGADAD
jgi:hypothetical protein